MFYKKYEDENGEVRDADGKRYGLSECVAAGTPKGLNVGYTEFASRDECLAAWGLTDVPEEERFPMPPMNTETEGE